MNKATEKLLAEIGNFNKVEDLPDDLIQRLADSEISNYTFLQSWVTNQSYEGLGHMSETAGVKVLIKRGYENSKSILKELFLELSDFNWYGCDVLFNYILSMPKEMIKTGFIQALQACRDHEYDVAVEDYVDILNDLPIFPITLEEFGDKELYIWFREYLHRLYGNEYEHLFIDKL